ncbi:S49 family peptidase [Pseudoalteromonas piscicida]|uniref:S49 family peptidase n=1 Tax=Pseudoalteromonas piscicida TaxID=43662 RepID=UPI0006970888|nr:S49 family peptidase [Pseudoalteromonas piscicida]
MQHDNSYLHILSRACNQPQLLEPNYAATFFGSLSLRAGVNQLIDVNGNELKEQQLIELSSSFSSPRERDRPYQVVNGLAILPVSGTLLHKYGYIKPVSGATGYDGISARLNDAIADPNIKAIMLDIDSPGGEGAGCFDCANQIKKLREVKPIYALCYDTMCSAAMALASACTERWITQSGRAGSVGVVVAHSSIENKLKEEGVEITLIHSGDHKIDGNPYSKLPPEIRESIQSRLDKTRDEFAELVASGIGMSKSAILDTQAQIFTGQAAIDVGFANKLVNGHEAVPILLDVIKSNNSIGVSMSEKQENPTPSEKPNKAQLTQADIDAAKLEGATLERQRIGEILNSEHAEGRQKLAVHLALSSAMSPTESVAMLQVSPKAESESKSDNLSTALDAAMENEPQPDLETSGDVEELSDYEKEAQALLSAHDQVFGN